MRKSAPSCWVARPTTIETASANSVTPGKNVLPSLADWLSHEDRHIRANVAFIFGRLGDPRGFEALAAILSDRSDRPEGQGIGTAPSDGRYHVAQQVRADRYYAALLLGRLRDPRAVPVLVSLLNDPDVTTIVPSALGQIGDRSALAPLLDRLDHTDPFMVVRAIQGLELLQAREALPRLRSLLNDDRRATAGTVSVGEAAEAAIARLQQALRLPQ